MVSGLMEGSRVLSEPDRPEPELLGPRLGRDLEELLQQARGGSRAALGELLQRCRRYLLLVANESLDSDLRRKAAASDLVQDTFLEAHRDFADFKGSTECELLAWLTRILSHRLSNKIRHFRVANKRNIGRELSLDAEGDAAQWGSPTGSESPVQGAMARDEADRLHEALARLPATMRRIIVLRTWERRSFAEIAASLDSTPEAARKAWGRAVRRLKAELKMPP